MKNRKRLTMVRLNVARAWKILCFSFMLFFCAVITCEAKETSTVRVGYFYFAGFNDYNEDGKMTGYGYDYLMNVQKYTEWEYEFVQVSPTTGDKLTYEEAMQMLCAGELDLVGTVRKNEEREEKMLFPIYPSGSNIGVLTVRNDDSRYKAYDSNSFHDMVIGLLTGSSRNEEIREYMESKGIQNIAYQEYGNVSELTKALQDKEVDAIYTSSLRRTEHESAILKLNKSDYYFAVNMKRPDLLSDMNRAIQNIDQYSPYFIQELNARYYSSSSINEFTLTESQQKYVEEHPIVYIATVSDMAPIEYLNSDGAYCGAVADILERLEQLTGFQFQYVVDQTRAENLVQMQMGELQVLSAFPDDYFWADSNGIHTTVDYMECQVNAITSKRSHFQDGYGKIAVERSRYITKLLQELYPDAEYFYYDTVDECVEAVNDGDVDITFLPSYCSNLFINRARYMNLITYNVPELGYRISLGVSQECDSELFEILNEAIASISQEEVDSAVMNNVVNYKEEESIEDFLYHNSLVIVIIFAILMVAVLFFCMFYIYMKKKADGAKKMFSDKISLALSKTKISIWDYNMSTKTLISQGNGYGDEEEIWKNVPERQISQGKIHPDSIAEYRRLYERVLGAEYNVSCEVQMIDSKHEYHWYRITYSEITEKDYQRHAIGVSELIDDQKAAEQAFSAEQIYRKNILSEAIYFFMIDLTKNRVEEARKNPNGENENLYFRTGNEIVKFLADSTPNVEERFQLVELLNVENLREEYSTGQKNMEYEYRCITDNGETEWRSVSIRMFENPYSGDIMGFIFTKNINKERIDKMVRDNLLTSLRLAIENSFAYLVLLDLKQNKYEYVHYPQNMILPPVGKIEDLEKHMKQISSDKEKSVLYQDLLHIDMFEEQIRRDGRVEAQERLFIDGDYQWYEIIGEVEENTITGGLVCIIMVRNIQKTKMSEEELRITVKRAEKAAKAKQEFLSNMSHEIRTPLNGIRGMLELLREEEAYKENNYVEKAYISAQHLSGLVNDILDMSKIESGKIELRHEYVSGKELGKYLAAIVTPLVDEKGLHLIRELDTGNMSGFYGDAGRVKQVIINIITNAVKYTERGGTIYYRCKVVNTEGDRAKVIYSVQDTGIGMSEEFLKRAFVPFEQVDTSYNRTGTGLGLAITKSLVEIMGGEIQIQSKLGEGTTVTFSLPVEIVRNDKQELLTSEKIQSDDVQLEMLKGKRALVVEDHEINMEIAVKQLSKFGIQVTKAFDGQEGVEIFEQSEEGFFDIIFMDIMMPRLDGLQATKVIREMNRGDAGTIPIVAMTANAFAEDVHKSLDNGMNYHLSKPFDRTQMQQVLLEALI